MYIPTQMLTNTYDNIQYETERLGFLDSEIIWMYQFFTDCRISPVTYTRKQLEMSFGEESFTVSSEKSTINYQFADESCCVAYMAAGKSDCVHIVEFFSKGFLARKDYYTYCRIYSEYYIPCDNRAKLKRYMGKEPKVVAIPVVGLDELKMPKGGRRVHSLISAGRLASEKHMGWVIEAVVEARKSIPDLTLDIYGEGSEEAKLRNQIAELNCEDYVRLCGFQKLDEVYQNYDAYVSASWVETLGVTLLEAVGSGLPIVGFDVPYGMQSFVDEGENGYKVPWGDVKGLAKGIVRLFTEADMNAFREHSYEKAKYYFREELKKRWLEVLCQVK